MSGYTNLSIHLLIEGHSGCFQVLALMSKVALNIHVHFGGSEYKFSIHLGKYIFFIQHVNSLRSLLEWARVHKIILHLIYVSWLNHLESSTWTDSEEANSGMRTRVTHCTWTEGERKIFSLFIVKHTLLKGHSKSNLTVTNTVTCFLHNSKEFEVLRIIIFSVRRQNDKMPINICTLTSISVLISMQIQFLYNSYDRILKNRVAYIFKYIQKEIIAYIRKVLSFPAVNS